MIATSPLEARKLIGRTAGRLFAEHGYEATSLDMIADEAGFTVDQLVYWIRSKENLYAAVFLMLLDEDRQVGINTILNDYPEWADSSFGQAQVIRLKILAMFNNLRSNDHPWKAALIARELGTRILSKENQLEYIVQTLTDDLYHFCRDIKSDLTEEELEIVCRCFPLSQMASFVMMASRECKDYASFKIDPIRFENHIWFTTATILGYLRLPPQELLSQEELFAERRAYVE